MSNDSPIVHPAGVFSRHNASRLRCVSEQEGMVRVCRRCSRRAQGDANGFYEGAGQDGRLAKIRRYMIVHSEGVPQFDLLHTAKALRCYARGALDDR